MAVFFCSLGCSIVDRLARQDVLDSDTLAEAPLQDQPHLTRSLKQWTGHTPAQIARMHQSG